MADTLLYLRLAFMCVPEECDAPARNVFYSFLIRGQSSLGDERNRLDDLVCG